MRVLHVHNFYQLPGGEDQTFAATGSLLEKHGHEVIRFTLENKVVADIGRLTTARRAVWSTPVHQELRRLIQKIRPDIAHFENTFPLVSPAAYYACHAEGVPVVQTLHNFRIVCPSGLLYRNDSVCERCVGKSIAWPGILHGCYRGSRLGSAAVAIMITTHRILRTWQRHVDAYIALNGFVRAKFIEAGLPAERVHVNPNFLTSDPGPGQGAGGYALFAGRLSPEKGINTLLTAWQELAPELPLKILGDGPEVQRVTEAAARYPSIEWLGWRPVEDVLGLIAGAKFVVVPSVCYETFNRTQLEAFASGTPVVASRLGSMQAMVEHRRTGLLFTPHDPGDLVRQVRWLLNSPKALSQMRLAARQKFEDHYTCELSYHRLMGIYHSAHEQIQQRRCPPRPLHDTREFRPFQGDPPRVRPADR
jgi:glycosyltransferase involved in cell wall biosynthesis